MVIYGKNKLSRANSEIVMNTSYLQYSAFFFLLFSYLFFLFFLFANFIFLFVFFQNLLLFYLPILFNLDLCNRTPQATRRDTLPHVASPEVAIYISANAERLQVIRFSRGDNYHDPVGSRLCHLIIVGP